jgi:hypothetical protein
VPARRRKPGARRGARQSRARARARAGLVLRIFLALLPWLLAIMGRVQGLFSQSMLDFSVVTKYYVFQARAGRARRAPCRALPAAPCARCSAEPASGRACAGLRACPRASAMGCKLAPRRWPAAPAPPAPPAPPRRAG